jgi:hypothetical protein
MRNYAVIPTANRPEVCLQAVESIKDQVDVVHIIDNGTEGRLTSDDLPDNCLLVLLDREGLPPNLSKFWNIGLGLAAMMANDSGQWNVAIVNDDAIVPPGWMEAVTTRMREAGAAAGCSGSPQWREILHTRAEPVDLRTRMQGWAFVLAGEKGVRANEALEWWFGDDHLDWVSRQLGGTLMIPGFPVVNQFPNGQMTPELQEQANRDAETFKAYWGERPW